MRPGVLLRLSALALAGAAAPASAGVIAGYDPNNNNRFSSNFPGDPSSGVYPTANTSPSFVLSGFDLSGVGWQPFASSAHADGTKGVTMVSPVNFIAAAHYAPAIGSTLFFDPSTAPNGPTVSRTVVSTIQVKNPDGSNSDVLFGTLNAPFTAADHVTYYPIPTSRTKSDYNNVVLYNYDQRAQMGRNNFSAVDTSGIFTPYGGPHGNANFAGTGVTSFYSYDFDTVTFDNDAFPGFIPPLNHDEFAVESGDSGSPTFMIQNGQLSLLGAHYALFSNNGSQPFISVDSFLPDYRDNINTLISVPEPGTLALGGLGAAGAVGCWLRRRTRRPGAA